MEITDIIIPSCSDLSSLSIDAWQEGEEKDAKRVAIVSDIGTCGCVLKDLHPPPVCQFVKVRLDQSFILPRNDPGNSYRIEAEHMILKFCHEYTDFGYSRQLS